MPLNFCHPLNLSYISYTYNIDFLQGKLEKILQNNFPLFG